MSRAGDCRRFYDGGANSLRRPPISVRGGAQSLRRSAMFIMGVRRAWGVPGTEPETVCNFHHGGAQSLRRPAILVIGEHRKCPEPETVGDFMTGAQTA